MGQERGGLVVAAGGEQVISNSPFIEGLLTKKSIEMLWINVLWIIRFNSQQTI